MSILTVNGLSTALGYDQPTIRFFIQDGVIGQVYQRRKKLSYIIYPEKVRQVFGTEVLEKAIEYSK